MNKFIKYSIVFLITLSFLNCTNLNDKTKLVIETEYSSITIENFCVAETINGFEINFDKDFVEEIQKGNAKRVYFEKTNKKIEINFFKILYSKNEEYNNQTPITPKGKIAIFKSKKGVFLDIISKDKNELTDFLKPIKIIKYASR